MSKRAMERVVVVGGSLAGVRAAEALRENGYTARLTVVDGDRFRPYDRYHLSKDYLNGIRDRDQIGLATAHIDATWLQGRVAVALDYASRSIRLDDGTELEFDGLIVATGSRARTLEPEHMALTGVLSLRTLSDGQALRAALVNRPSHVVVVGGGLIGSEVATVTRDMGLPTTIVDSTSLPLSRTLGRTMASTVIKLHEQNDVELRYGAKVQAVEGHNGSVRAVHLTTGERLPADLVVVCLGVTPNTDWMEGSGLSLSDGLLCDETLFSLDTPDVVAAGDVARWPSALCGEDPIRVEHWRSTLDQAAVAAGNLLLGRSHARPFVDLPVFGTHIHGRHFRSMGFPQYSTDSATVEGSIDSDKYLVGFYRDDVLIGVIALDALDSLPAWSSRIGLHSTRGRTDLTDVIKS
jgi:3-phenylpropionate/trans-cinnamate dioxygenase ferredoxin reductase subunit